MIGEHSQDGGSAQSLREFLGQIPECIKIVSQAGDLLEMNQAGLRMVEADRAEEVLGKSVFGIIAPEWREAFQAMHQRVCAGGQETLQFEIIGLKGTRRTMEATARAYRPTPASEVVHLAIARDVTERREAEEALRRSQTDSARLAAIVDHSDDAIISKNLSGIIQTWNKGAERLFGYTAEEAIGKSVTILIPEDRINEEPGIIAEIRQGNRVDHYETLRRRKDGELRHISLTVSPIKDATGRIVGASKIARDITERKMAEAALKESESLLRELADSMPQIVWVARPDGQFEYFNKRWFEFTGDGPEGLLCDNYRMAIHPDDRQRVTDGYYESVRTERPFSHEYRLRRRDGEFHWFLGRAEAARDASGKVLRWFGACTDIDDQKRAEEKLERTVAERTASLREAIGQMEEFSYTVSHDLRAPLRAMHGYSEALLQDFAPALPEEAQHALRRIATNATRLDKMILDVLTYSRIARGAVKQERVSLDKLARQIIEHYPGMQSPRAKIHVDPLPDVIGHEASLTQVMSNLLGNAVKFVAAGVVPEVRIWAESEGDTVRVWIADNGIGINPSHQHKLFSMFERLHPTLKYEGTGVGLAIVRKAVERMGGRVGVESEAGKGSRFWIELKGAGPEEAAAQGEEGKGL